VCGLVQLDHPGAPALPRQDARQAAAHRRPPNTTPGQFSYIPVSKPTCGCLLFASAVVSARRPPVDKLPRQLCRRAGLIATCCHLASHFEYIDLACSNISPQRCHFPCGAPWFLEPAEPTDRHRDHTILFVAIGRICNTHAMRPNSIYVTQNIPVLCRKPITT